MSNDDNPLPPELGQPARSGDEAIRQIEALKRQPARFSCLGMSGTVILLAALAVWLFFRLR